MSSSHRLEDERDPLEVLAERFAARCRAGQNPSVEEYTDSYPEHADRIRQLFPSVALMEQLRSKVDHQRGAFACSPGLPSHHIGDYEILREAGRGGMGIVYESIQKSLDRRVALKVLNSKALSSPRQIRRFEREARAAARLHHTNIVPVFGVGQEHGFHFYAMQFIDGVSIQEIVSALREWTSEERRDSCDEPDPPGSGNLNQNKRRQTALHTAMALCRGDHALSPTLMVETTQETRNSSDSLAIPLGDTIDSHGLSEPIGDLKEVSGPLPNLSKLGDPFWKSVARIGVQVAGALQYAHAQGVLHRDIKPANLLLDRQVTVWVVDFGLAKGLAENNLTNSGDIVGTLGYMSPEQFEGKCDVRSDVYSLGLTLHELLTLRPALNDTTCNGLANKLPVTPLRRPRSLNPGIPVDLETIVMKATAPVPAHRFQTAGEMVEDLERFLEGRPILSRRTGVATRLLRWSRRNPAMAFWIGTAAILLLTVALVSAWGNFKTNAALVESESNLGLAIDAVESIFESISFRGVPRSIELDLQDVGAPRFETEITAADAELLSQLLRFYEQFVARNGVDIELQLKRARAHRRVGEIHQRLGRFPDAEISYLQSLRMYEALLKKDSASLELVVAKADVLNQLGVLANQQGLFWSAVRSHQRAIRFLRGQPQAITVAAGARFALAESHNLLGSISIRGGVVTNYLGDSRGNRRSQLAASSRNGVGRRAAGSSLDAVDRELARAADLYARLDAEQPGNLEIRLARAQCYRHQLVQAARMDRIAEAIELYQKAVNILEQLMDENPNDPKCLFELADALSLAGSGLPVTETPSLALQHLALATDHSERLLSIFPRVPEYQALNASAHGKLAVVQHMSGDLAEAEQSFKVATSGLQSLVARSPSNAFYQVLLAQTVIEFADLLRDKRQLQLQAASELLLQALERFESFRETAGVSRNPFLLRILSRLYLGLSETYEGLGDQEMAGQYARKSERASDRPWVRGRGRFRNRFWPGFSGGRRPSDGRNRNGGVP